MGPARNGAYLWGMTTYTTPHFANGLPDRNVRPERESTNRARTAPAATYRTAGVSNEAAVLADGPTPDWQPAASKGIPKAAIGALGAALVGGVALAIVLMAPSNKVTKTALPDPIAQAAAANASTQKSNDSTDASVKQMNDQAPAAGLAAPTAAATTEQRTQAATDATQAAAVPAPVQAVIPQAPPVANAPVARLPRHTVAPVATPRVAAPVEAPSPAVAPTTPSVEPQAPAMQQTPEPTTVSPEVPTPAPVQPTPTPDSPTPVPAQ